MGLMCGLFLPQVSNQLSDDVTRPAPPPQNTLPRMDPSRADPHLGAETMAKIVREANACVQEHARRVVVAHRRAVGQSRLRGSVM